MSFVRKHGLWSAEHIEAADRLRRIAEERGLQTIRFSFPDQHGLLRGKTLIAGEALSLIEGGCSVTTTLLAKDTSRRTVFPVFMAGGGFGMSEMEGGGDLLMVADPTTFKVLPWAPATGWVLCDLYFANGHPVPFATRGLYRSVLEQLSQRGYRFKAGLEVECHIFKLENPRLAPTDAGHPGQPGEAPAGCQPAVPGLLISDRAALRSDGAGARCGPSRSRRVELAASVDRGRIWPKPM